MSDRPFEQSMYPHYAAESADARDNPVGLGEHLAEDTAGAGTHDPEELGGADLADELEGRPTPPFRTPHPDHESS
ncbi:hypothetical protein LQ327_01055 [Actinomycetospora endophytica]|uniref:DUF5709 domain-containing protein n=1 Tax=Actinomycetospora endophytica TaxID=2291215 RepID=A0ABS8P146_9PSEU|nr:hypothetical protein [Actinomycetospora endophytica]MCD2191978.1 hypothetical protein [Actinomycetospora endophytica]